MQRYQLTQWKRRAFLPLQTLYSIRIDQGESRHFYFLFRSRLQCLRVLEVDAVWRLTVVMAA